MRRVFKTTDGLVEPGSKRADGSDVWVASLHRFRDRQAPVGAAGGSKVSDVAADSAAGVSFGSTSRPRHFCSGLVDLVVCVGHHGGGGHRLALAGERVVGLVAEDRA